MRKADGGARLWAVAALAGAAGFALGAVSGPSEAHRPPDFQDAGGARVTGVGGIFFKSRDPAAAAAWYRKHLGIVPGEWGGAAFLWREHEDPEHLGYTVWGPFPRTTTYFEPSERSFMVNFRVRDLRGLMSALRAEGVRTVGEIEEHPNGLFAWILDPDGTKIELWEPIDSGSDPYLR